MSNITRWNPLREMMTMQSAFDRLFDDMRTDWAQLGMNERGITLDINETAENYLVEAELPGVSAENINVTMQDDVLTIAAEIPEKTVEHTDQKVLIRERRSGQMSRSIRLPHSIDNTQVEAEYADGVLRLTLPKTENNRTRAIPVRVRGEANNN